jgi:hypothetical protein
MIPTKTEENFFIPPEGAVNRAKAQAAPECPTDQNVTPLLHSQL